MISDGLDLELIIAGEGNQRAELESVIATLGRQDRIYLLGHRTDTIDLYQAMDIFVMSSLREGLPLALLEAMSTKVPVVATRIAGIPNLVLNEVNGLLVEPGNEEQLAATLARLAKDSKLRRRFQEAGRHTVESRYSIDMITKRIRDVYDEVLNGTK